MDERFELTIELPLSAEQAFDFFSDPEELSRAAGAPRVRELSGMPATTGVQWTTKQGPFGTTRHLVTTSERPYRRVVELAGAVDATIEDRFEQVDGHARVTRQFRVHRLPPRWSPDQFRAAQQASMHSVSSQLERRGSAGIAGETERVESQLAVRPSTVAKRRKQIEIELRAEVEAPPAAVFDAAVRRVCDYWQWMSYRSEPTVDYQVSPDWPAEGASYTYRMRAKEPFNRWEDGVCRVQRCDPPEYALLREEEHLRLFANIVMIEWQLTGHDDGTSLRVRYEITARNRVLNMLSARQPEAVADSLRRGIAKLIRELERR